MEVLRGVSGRVILLCVIRYDGQKGNLLAVRKGGKVRVSQSHGAGIKSIESERNRQDKATKLPRGRFSPNGE